jgi:hypothetical protein
VGRITYAIFRTFEEEWAWLVKQRAEEGPRGGAMEPTNQGEGSQGVAKLSQVILTYGTYIVLRSCGIF